MSLHVVGGSISGTQFSPFIGEKNPENFRLLINGRRIQDNQTPQNLGIESGNVITVESTGRITITIQGISFYK